MSATYAFATAMFDCIAPLNSRTVISIHNAVAIAVTKKLSASPQKPTSSTGRRPKRSDKPPMIGEPKKLAMPKANVTTPYQNAWSACEPVKVPTNGGSTGMIRPIATMSISTVSMMKRIAAVRSAGAAAGRFRESIDARCSPADKPARLSCWSSLSEGARGKRCVAPSEAAHDRLIPCGSSALPS